MPDIGVYHPQIVHFVIAFLILGVAARVLSLLPLGERFRFLGPMAAVLVILGTLAAVAAFQSGHDAHGPVEHVPGAREAVLEHEHWGERTRNAFLILAAIELGVLALASRRRLAQGLRAVSAVGGLVVRNDVRGGRVFSQEGVEVVGDGMRGHVVALLETQQGEQGKVLYVWFDAPIGYVSFTRDHFAALGRPEEWKRWWRPESPEDTRLVHFIGKDNIPFHTIIWPSILMGHSDARLKQGLPALNLPYDVPANEFLNLEGRKMSTSQNFAVWLPDYLERYDPDPLRYYLTAVMPETRDADWETPGAQPFTLVFAAGNAGFSGPGAPTEAKNLIAVAASQSHRAGNIDDISSFSSRGFAVDGRVVPTVAAPGETIELEIPPPAPEELAPEPIDLAIVHEDDAIIVVDKPAGMVVHPAPGHQGGTLVNALLHHVKDLSGVGGEARLGDGAEPTLPDLDLEEVR